MSFVDPSESNVSQDVNFGTVSDFVAQDSEASRFPISSEDGAVDRNSENLASAVTTSIPSNLLRPHFYGILGEYVAHKNQIDEYKEEMILHLILMERLGRPCLEQMEMQPEVTLRMRPLLLDFLMDVINRLNLSKSTFPLTVNLIDRYASLRVVKKKHYQLLGLTALWVACKNLDAKVSIPRLDDLCRYCCRCYDRTMFLEMENHLLKSLDWLVDTPTVDTFVDVFIYMLSPYCFLAGSKMSHQECTTIKIVANFFCELTHFYPQIQFGILIPQLALASVVVACTILRVCTPDDYPAVLKFMLQECGEHILAVLQLELAVLHFRRISSRPPPSLKSKYLNNEPNCLNLAAVLAIFNAKKIPLQLHTPLEPLALTPAPLGESSPVPLTLPQMQVSLAEAVVQVFNEAVDGAGTLHVDADIVSTTDAADSSAMQEATDRECTNAFPLPSLLPGQNKRKFETDKSETKRARNA